MPAVTANPDLHADLGDVLPDEFAQWKNPALLANFETFRRYNSRSTELRWVRVSCRGQLAAVVPVVRLSKRKVTDILRPELRRWLGPTLGLLAKKTTMLVDTAFLAFDDRSPFHAVDGVDRQTLKPLVSDLLKAERGVDSVWFTEREDESAWAAGEGYEQFYVLPMAHVETAGFADFDAYLAALSKKRRRNYRHEREAFESASAEFEIHADGLSDSLIEELVSCLRASAAHSQLHVPYNDVLTDPRAFAEQDQLVLAARVDGTVVGFMSFLVDGRRLLQCHGGLDYHRSHEVLAYHNLIYRAIEYAISEGFDLMSMGPLNNETKRRAATRLIPMVGNLWSRNPIDRLAARAFFIKNLEVYRGYKR